MDRAKLREGLRREGLYVAEGDPVLELAAICEVALADTLKVIERVTKQQADRVTAASTQAVVDARKEAEVLINDAGHWIEARIKAAGDAVAASMIASVRQETEGAKRAMRVSLRAAWVIGIFGLIALSGVTGMALAALEMIASDVIEKVHMTSFSDLPSGRFGADHAHGDTEHWQSANRSRWRIMLLRGTRLHGLDFSDCRA